MEKKKKKTEYRVGIGFDLHSFGQEAYEDNNNSLDFNIIVGGIAIPHNKKLQAHSDGDFLLHALTDAILGTISGGSIGSVFSNRDSRWKGCNSAEFVRYAHDELAKKGGRLINIDACIIAESPKIMPFATEIRSSMADILGIKTTRINIKATTSEGVGCIGRGEAIAAQVVCMVELEVEDDNI